MDKSYSTEPDVHTAILHTNAPLALLDAGLHCIREGQSAHALACFEEAHIKVGNQQSPLAVLLETFIHAYTHHEQVKEKLFQAIRQFSTAEDNLEALIKHLEHYVYTHLSEYTEPASLSSNTPLATPSHSQRENDKNEPKGEINQRCEQDIHLRKDSSTHVDNATSALDITCFGHFEVRREGKIIELCSSRSGQSILRYLVVQQRHSTTSDTLISMLWPDDELEIAQHKLHISISALRRSLNRSYHVELGSGYILCKNHIYSLNATIDIHTDVDAFLEHYHVGQHSSDRRIYHYEQACQLYTGPFLVEDMYADWSFLQREQLCQAYLTMCRTLAEHYLSEKRYEDARKWGMLLLNENTCDEIAHRLLIHIYAAQGRRSEAFQQYQQCQRILREQIGVAPMAETTRIVQSLLS